MSYAQRVFDQARRDGMPSMLSQCIVGQAGHETNGFSSSVFQSCNNAFGYKWVGQSTADGACTGSPEGDYYARYSNIEQSTHELTQWIRRRQAESIFPADLSTITSPAQYAQLLKDAGFYGDSVNNYAMGVLRWMQQLPVSVGGAASGIFLLVAGVMIFVNRKRLFKTKMRSIFE
jgi:hypothetical protein